MTRAGRKATATLAAAATMTVGGRASANEQEIAVTDQRETAIVLNVANYAALSRHVLDGARVRVEKVYEAIGVRIVWIDSGETVRLRQDGSLHLTVILHSRDMAEQRISAHRIADHVLGHAHPSSGRAYIFCHRVALTSGAPALFPLSLGNVIAHEMGHLVLRENSHSQKGLMRANVDLHAIHLQNFDESQASTIRTMLLELTAGATAR